MGQVSLSSDFMGNQSQTELNQKNLEALITEFNRSQQQLDSLNSDLKIIASGKATDNYPGTPGGNTVSIPINVGQGNTFIGFYSRSDRPGFVQPIPEYNFDTLGNIQFYIFMFTNGNFINFQWNAYQSLTPFTWNFFYFLFQQPAASQAT